MKLIIAILLLPAFSFASETKFESFYMADQGELVLNGTLSHQDTSFKIRNPNIGFFVVAHEGEVTDNVLGLKFEYGFLKNYSIYLSATYRMRDGDLDNTEDINGNTLTYGLRTVGSGGFNNLRFGIKTMQATKNGHFIGKLDYKYSMEILSCENAVTHGKPRHLECNANNGASSLSLDFGHIFDLSEGHFGFMARVGLDASDQELEFDGIDRPDSRIDLGWGLKAFYERGISEKVTAGLGLDYSVDTGYSGGFIESSVWSLDSPEIEVNNEVLGLSLFGRYELSDTTNLHGKVYYNEIIATDFNDDSKTLYAEIGARYSF